MGIKFTNNASATLAASINSTVTTISVTTGQGARFPTLMAGDYFFATLVDSSNNMEIIKVTNRVTDTMTVVRAQDGTTGRSFLANDRVELRPVAASFNALQEFTPSGTIAANTLSGAIVELDSEKAGINSPAFTGTPTAPTATAGTNTTQLATTAFTTTAVTNERSATTTLTNKTINGANNTLTVRLDQSDVTGTLPVNKGGTGQTSYTNGQLLIGNTTGNTLAKATLTAGTGISITNGAGSITIANTSTTPNFQRFLHQASQPQTFTIPAEVTRVKVTVVGGGGGYSGPGATGGTSTVASGTQSITAISATGGGGSGGNGGLGSNGDLNMRGGAGASGSYGYSFVPGGAGGNSILGGGGGSDAPGGNYGGGSGGPSQSSSCGFIQGAFGAGAGGAAIKWLSGLTPGNTLSVTVGAGGTSTFSYPALVGAPGVVIFEW